MSALPSRRHLLGAAAALAMPWPGRAQPAQTLLNVSYDVSREFYKDFTPHSPRTGRRPLGRT